MFGRSTVARGSFARSAVDNFRGGPAAWIPGGTTGAGFAGAVFGRADAGN
jgi:hypothetical protein